jgi:large subunit ribosomal protein L20
MLNEEGESTAPLSLLVHPLDQSRPNSTNRNSKYEILLTISESRLAKMPRVRKGAARHRSKKRILKATKGYRSSRGHLYRKAKEATVRAAVNARIDRKRRKRDFRGLWIIRLSAACRQRGIRYSEFINGLKKADIALNRKMLSEIVVDDQKGFDAVVEAAGLQKS